jgi:lipopolysaccharide heptosyltransferase II
LECPYIDELIVADFKNKDSSLPALFKLGAALRKRNFDIVIDLQNNRKSHILSFLTLALKRYGYDNKKLGFLLNFRIKDDKAAIDPVTHQFRILKMLGIDSQRTPLELWLSKQDTQYIDDLLSSQWLSVNQKIVGINISASQRWASKALPLSHIVKVCQGLGRQDIRVIVTGTESDSGAAGTLMNMAKETKIINACGRTTINQLACLIRKCAVYVSGDSSPLHIAAAVGTPFIALFGPTDPRRHLVPVESYALIHKHLSCSPCYKPKCKSKKCMELIRPEEVLGAVDKLLNKN